MTLTSATKEGESSLPTLDRLAPPDLLLRPLQRGPHLPFFEFFNVVIIRCNVLYGVLHISLLTWQSFYWKRKGMDGWMDGNKRTYQQPLSLHPRHSPHVFLRRQHKLVIHHPLALLSQHRARM